MRSNSSICYLGSRIIVLDQLKIEIRKTLKTLHIMAASAEIWPCPKCTYHNEIDILKCILCTTDKPLEPSSTNTNNHNINNKNDKSEQEDDDDLDTIFDLTQYDDSN
eukprot:294495_1